MKRDPRNKKEVEHQKKSEELKWNEKIRIEPNAGQTKSRVVKHQKECIDMKRTKTKEAKLPQKKSTEINSKGASREIQRNEKSPDIINKDQGKLKELNHQKQIQ
jgi:hypothetical protein